MRKLQANRVLVPLLLAFLMVACKPSIPRKYIQPDKLEAILYDCHLAQGIAQAETYDAHEREMNELTLREAVFKKHGVTNAEFDSSMVYYFRHTDKISKIYDRLSKRMSNDAMALGASASDVNKYVTISNSGDTANIWRGERAVVILPVSPYNRLTFSYTADSTFHQGDKLMLNFETQFLYQDGMKDGVAMLAVKFANDSVANRVIHMSSSSIYSLQLNDDKHLGIKEVKGFIYLGNNDPKSTTLRVMFVKTIQLIRMRESRVKPSKQNEMQTGANAPTQTGANGQRLQKDSLPPPHRRLPSDSIQSVRGAVQLKK